MGGEGGAVLQLQRFSRSDSDGFSRHQVSWCCTDLEAFLTQVRSILQQQTTHWLTTTEVSQVKVCLQPLVGCNRLEKRCTIAAIMAEFKSFPSMCKHSTQNFSKMTCIRARWIHTLNMWKKYVYIYIYRQYCFIYSICTWRSETHIWTNVSFNITVPTGFTPLMQAACTPSSPQSRRSAQVFADTGAFTQGKCGG